MALTLSLEQTQKQTLSQQQQVALALLEAPLATLLADIELIVDENPLLESTLEESDTLVERRTELDNDDFQEPDLESVPLAENVSVDEVLTRESTSHDISEDNFIEQLAATPSLKDELLSELNCLALESSVAVRAQILIDELDEHGLLNAPLQALMLEYREVLERFGLSTSPDATTELVQWQKAHEALRRIAPPGIGAESLSESLVWRLEERAQGDVEPSYRQHLLLAARIVRSYLSLAARGQSERIARTEHIPLADVEAALLLLRSLPLYPRLASEQSESASYISPELSVSVSNGELQLSLITDPCRSVRWISEQALAEKRATLPKPLWNQFHQEGRELLAALSARRNTLLRITQYLVSQQRSLFSEGWGALKHIPLAQIAQAVSLSQSTVSRALSGKYLLTPLGTVPLTWLAWDGAGARQWVQSLTTLKVQATPKSPTGALPAETTKTETVTATPTAVPATEDASQLTALMAIRELVDHENQQKPLSDAKIAELLAARGINVSRRTVAKYRDLLCIPATYLRRAPAP